MWSYCMLTVRADEPRIGTQLACSNVKHVALCSTWQALFSHRSRNILDDFREAYYWLRQNTDEHARVMSWWDYGYQIAGMANRTTLVDNNTWNNSHIALVRKQPRILQLCAAVCVFHCQRSVAVERSSGDKVLV